MTIKKATEKSSVETNGFIKYFLTIICIFDDCTYKDELFTMYQLESNVLLNLLATDYFQILAHPVFKM